MVHKTYNFNKEVESKNNIKNEYSYSVENIKPVTTTLKVQSCNGATVFKVDSDFGTEDSKRSFNEVLKKIKDDGIYLIKDN